MLKRKHSAGRLEAGCDEAGRGCLAGPVVAAAVILPEDFDCPELNDSKQLSEKLRNKIRAIIEEKAVAWEVAFVGPEEIDKINILNASILAMHRAIEKLKITPQHLLIDGDRFKVYPGIPHHCIVKGDAEFQSIAAASVLAKTWRDEHMQMLHLEFPGYGWCKNKGYPTTDHRLGIRSLGSCVHHRKSFTLIPPQLELEF